MKHAKKLLTDRTLRAIKAAPAGERYYIYDSLVPGLAICVTDTGHQSYILYTRFPGSSGPARKSIARVGAITLADAREKASDWHKLIARGIDPTEEERKEREAAKVRRSNTFGAVAEEFIARHLVGQRKAKQVEREIRKELIAPWRDKPIVDISPDDVKGLIRRVKDRGAFYVAHSVLSEARSIFGFAIDQGGYGLSISPCDRIRPGKLIGAKKSRQRVLNDEELRAYCSATNRLQYPWREFYQLLLLTGQRKNEVSRARWSEFDEGQRVWTIPPERYKSDAVHIVPLTTDVLAILQFNQTKEKRDWPRFVAGDFLFSTTGGEKPIGGFSKIKATFDVLMLQELRTRAATLGFDPKTIKLEPWVNHDVRRTVRTRLSELRVSFEVAELIIGHTLKGLSRVYDQHKFLDERREALEAWGRRLSAILHSQSE